MIMDAPTCAMWYLCESPIWSTRDADAGGFGGWWYHFWRSPINSTVRLLVTPKWLAVKTASEMTYTVSSGALNFAQPIQSVRLFIAGLKFQCHICCCCFYVFRIDCCISRVLVRLRPPTSYIIDCYYCIIIIILYSCCILSLWPLIVYIFARSGIYAIARICYCPSVHLSVTWVDQSKTVEVSTIQLSPPSSPMTLVSSRLTSRQN